MFRNVTFSDLEQFLFNLGFVTVPTTGSHKVFKHTPSDALVALPDYQSNAYVQPIHLVAVRRILVEYGLIEQSAFDGFVQKVLTQIQKVPVDEVQQNLLKYLKEVEAGGSIVIVQEDKAIAELKPIGNTSK